MEQATAWEIYIKAQRLTPRERQTLLLIIEAYLTDRKENRGIWSEKVELE